MPCGGLKAKWLAPVRAVHAVQVSYGHAKYIAWARNFNLAAAVEIGMRERSPTSSRGPA